MNGNNPFELVTASKLTADEAVNLWCDDKRLDRARGRESCFVNGHRGTGKSMLFRILQHDCQGLLDPEGTPDFLGVYLPVRDSEFMVEEMELFQSDFQRNIVSESHLVLVIVQQLVAMVSSRVDLIPEAKRPEFEGLASRCVRSAYRYSTEPEPEPEMGSGGFDSYMARLGDLLEGERVQIVNYVCLRLYDQDRVFTGPLFLFDTLLGPLADFFYNGLGRCLFILVDDGDDLPRSHTIILNSWIARRRPSTVFKVSTMYGYKTFETKSGTAIQPPHDFLQYDIATRYLADMSEDYIWLLREICSKRLVQAGYESGSRAVDPYTFFPEDQEQVQRLSELAERLTERYRMIYKGRAVGDHVYRHLTSEYMRELLGRRASDAYVYAGFKTLAILSGGLVRDFIICAQKMFDNASRGGKQVEFVGPSIQNGVVREYADRLLDEIGDSRHKAVRSDEDWRAIRRVVDGLGATFKRKMFSEDAERRVFSFAFQSEPEEGTRRLLELAVTEGYLMKGFISRKEGTGRRSLYVLTRRLAPAFSLDVSAYAGYLSITPEMMRRFVDLGASASVREEDSVQTDLFYHGEGGEDAGGWVILEPEEDGTLGGE